MLEIEDSRSDSELIKDFADGDEGAFNALYCRYRKQLYGFLHNMIPGNNAEIDEVFEETWLKVIDKLHRYRDDGKFSAWLFRVAKNVFIDRIRKHHADRFVSIDREDVPDFTAQESGISPERVLGASDLGKAIVSALQTLPQEQKEVFLLREQDLSFKEISQIQSCSLNTVLSRMRYALQGLRKYLSQIDNGGLLK